MARKRQETLVLFKDVLNITEKFSDAQFGALMRAAFDYRFEGEGYQGVDALVELAFRMLEAQIDRYREACETNTKNAQREEPMCPAAQEVPETIPQEAPGESCANEGERNAAKCSRMPLIIVRIIIPIIIIILRLITMLIFIRRTRAAKSRPLLPFRRPAWRRCGRMQRRIESILIQQSLLTFIRPTIGILVPQR